MQSIKVALVQSHLLWEDKKANLRNFASRFTDIPGDIQLVVLPEMFSTAFSMHAPSLSESMQGPTIDWMKRMAAKYNFVLAASLIIEEKNSFFNRFVWVHPDGTILHYDKRHLFGLGGEPVVYKAGNKKVIIDFLGWKFCPMICYDLRFPVWIRNNEDYDCLVFVANWPAARSDQWEKLLYARAIENQCFVLAVNRIGKDNNNISHVGGSMALDPLGQELVKCGDMENILYVELNKDILNHSRKKLPFLKDRDMFALK
jgi:omega-amidase